MTIKKRVVTYAIGTKYGNGPPMSTGYSELGVWAESGGGSRRKDPSRLRSRAAPPAPGEDQAVKGR